MSEQKSPGRITPDDLGSCVYSPDDNREVQLDSGEKKIKLVLEQIVYTILGQQHGYSDEGIPVLYDVQYEDGQIDYAEDSVLAFAKESNFKGRTRYFLKIGQGGQIFNPIGLYEGAGKTSNQMRKGRHQYVWREVNKKAFVFYTEFLKTKVKRYLNNAQREII